MPVIFQLMFVNNSLGEVNLVPKPSFITQFSRIGRAQNSKQDSQSLRIL